MKLSLNLQIEVVEREIKMRESVYPRWVRSGKMRSGVADYELDGMRHVLLTLQWLEKNEARIKADSLP
jgi:hypothetical protein